MFRVCWGRAYSSYPIYFTDLLMHHNCCIQIYPPLSHYNLSITSYHQIILKLLQTSRLLF